MQSVCSVWTQWVLALCVSACLYVNSFMLPLSPPFTQACQTRGSSFCLRKKTGGTFFLSTERHHPHRIYSNTQTTAFLPSHTLSLLVFLSFCLYLCLGLYLYLICIYTTDTFFTFSNSHFFNLSSLFYIALISCTQFPISCFIYHKNRAQWNNGLLLLLKLCLYAETYWFFTCFVCVCKRGKEQKFHASCIVVDGLSRLSAFTYFTVLESKQSAP